jgi:class 3 adenylate cyclase
MDNATEHNAEHRLLSVLFCDIVDSTGHQFRMEPEQFAAVLKHYKEAVFDCVSRRGGYVARVIGDGILILFGWPSATGRDAQAAVRCALDVVARISRGVNPMPIAVRLAVETGWVLVGDIATANAPRGEIDHANVVGSAANIAARLQHFARNNGVIVGQGTLPLLGGRFIVEPSDTTGLNLPFPMTAAHILGDAGAGDPLGWLKRRFSPDCAVPTGRETLFQEIISHWRDAVKGAGRAVMVTGDPGVGKSCLVAASLNSIAADQPEIIGLFCDPSSRNRPLQPVADWLRLAMSLGSDAYPDEIRTRCADYASGLSLPETHVIAALASLLGAQPPGTAGPEQLRRQIFDVLAQIFIRMCQDRPLVILVEDLHWADPSTLELVAQIARTVPSRRMMLIGTSREHQPLAEHGTLDATYLTVGPLSPDAALQIINKLAATRGIALASGVQATIIERAEGVPLFVEEFVHSVADSRSFDLHPPGTIGQMLAARLDTLGNAKPIAQMASVLGREAPLDLLMELSGLPPKAFDTAVDKLLASDVMVRVGPTDKSALAFRHALLAEAAHNAMQSSRRQELHLQVARILQRVSPALAETTPGILADHLAKAGETVEAASLFRTAAERTLKSGAYREAESHARQALQLYEAMPERLLTLNGLMPLGEALIAARGYAHPEV